VDEHVKNDKSRFEKGGAVFKVSAALDHVKNELKSKFCSEKVKVEFMFQKCLEFIH